MSNTQKEMTVEKAKELLREAEARAFDHTLERQQEARIAERERIDAENAKFKKEQDVLLSRMNGLTVQSVEFFAEGEGALCFKFTDGTEFNMSASGDDATYITYGYDKDSLSPY